MIMNFALMVLLGGALGMCACASRPGGGAGKAEADANPYTWADYEKSEFFDPDWWGIMKDFWPEAVKGLREDNAGREPGGIVMLGDSITAAFDPEKYFSGKHVITRGVSGDRIIGVINRLDVSVDALKPSKVILLIGTNDTNNPKMTREEFVAEYQFLLDRLARRLPPKNIHVQTIMPRHSGYGTTNHLVREYNEEIRRMAREGGFTLVDVYPHFLNDKNELRADYSNDGVHMNEAGEKVWAGLLAPVIDR